MVSDYVMSLLWCNIAVSQIRNFRSLEGLPWSVETNIKFYFSGFTDSVTSVLLFMTNVKIPIKEVKSE